MLYIPNPTPLLGGDCDFWVDVTYEKRYAEVGDVTHDTEHIHDFYEIYVNLEGNVSFLVEDNVYAVSRGDIIITAPNELHRCIYHSDGFHEHFCIWIKDHPSALGDLRTRLGSFKKVEPNNEDRQRLFDLCFKLHRSHGQSELCFRAAEGFFGILDLLGTGTGNTQADAQSLPPSFSRIVDYIIEHYAEPSCSITSICKIFYISKSTLCRRFRRYFQTTPSDYIESKRFSEAKKLLCAGLSVQSACLNSGFSDCSYFIMRFRKKFGVTPYKYQREQA